MRIPYPKQAIVRLYQFIDLSLLDASLKMSLNELFSTMFIIISGTILRGSLIPFRVLNCQPVDLLYNTFSEALNFGKEVRVFFCDIN